MIESDVLRTLIDPAWLVLIAALAINGMSVVPYLRNIRGVRRAESVTIAVWSAGLDALSCSLLRMTPDRVGDGAGGRQDGNDL